MSIIIRIMMTLYVTLNIKKMVLKEHDLNVVEFNTLDLEVYGKKPYNELDMFLYHVIRKQMTGQIFLTAETARFIDIHYMAITKNYNVEKSDPAYYTETEFPAK